MPWTKKQQDLAHAVEHGFEPTGKAKGFKPGFAKQVTEESAHMRTRPPVKKRRKNRMARKGIN